MISLMENLVDYLSDVKNFIAFLHTPQDINLLSAEEEHKRLQVGTHRAGPMTLCVAFKHCSLHNIRGRIPVARDEDWRSRLVVANKDHRLGMVLVSYDGNCHFRCKGGIAFFDYDDVRTEPLYQDIMSRVVA